MITRDRPTPTNDVSIQNGYKKLNCIILTVLVLQPSFLQPRFLKKLPFLKNYRS